MIKALEPAFPVTETKETESVSFGMSLRTYLAGQAMMGLLANPALELPPHLNISQAAVREADDLIAELEKTEK